MRKLAALGLMLVLAGCDQGPKKQAVVQPPTEIGRWQIVPASTVPYNGGSRSGAPVYMAWRIDTRTGALEACSYYGGGDPLPGGPFSQETFSCSKPIEAAAP